MSLPFVFVMRLGIFRSSTCESDYTNALVVYIRGKTPLEGPHASLVIRLCHEDLRVSVHARNQPQADSPPDSFRHLALVDRSKARVLVVLDLAHLRNGFGHDAEVLQDRVSNCAMPEEQPSETTQLIPYLVVIHRVDIELVEHIPPRACLLL